MVIKILTTVLSALALFSINSCDTVDCQALCAPPPEGDLVADKINVTIPILIINNDGVSIQIDGPVQLLAGENWIDLINYTWIQVETRDTITSLRFTREGNIYTIDQQDFTFVNTNGFEAGSFLLDIRLDSNSTTISNDLLYLHIIPFDGSCNSEC